MFLCDVRKLISHFDQYPNLAGRVFEKKRDFLSVPASDAHEHRLFRRKARVPTQMLQYILRLFTSAFPKCIDITLNIKWASWRRGGRNKTSQSFVNFKVKLGQFGVEFPTFNARLPQ